MKSHEIHTEFLSLSWLSSPELAEQFRGALTADTQQSNLQEGSDGDGGAWKSRGGRTRQRGGGGGCPAAAASGPG